MINLFFLTQSKTCSCLYQTNLICECIDSVWDNNLAKDLTMAYGP